MARNCRKCMICGKKEFKSEEKLFFTTFPLDENRCKEWIKVVGNPELVYLPIEKLNKVRFLCGDHFVKKHFNKKGNRLRKTAVPQLKLTLPPLTEEQLKEFPCHVQSYQKDKIPGAIASTSQAAVHRVDDQIPGAIASTSQAAVHRVDENRKFKNSNDSKYFGKVQQRISDATGISRPTIRKILDKEEEYREKKDVNPNNEKLVAITTKTMQVYMCVICKVNRPPLFALSVAQRQIFEVIVSPSVDITELKKCHLLACGDCQGLIQTALTFQETALAGARHLLQLLPLVLLQRAPDPLEALIKHEPKVDSVGEAESEDNELLEAKSFMEIQIEPEKIQTKPVTSTDIAIKTEPDNDTEISVQALSIKSEPAPMETETLLLRSDQEMKIVTMPQQLTAAPHGHGCRSATLSQQPPPLVLRGRGGTSISNATLATLLQLQTSAKLPRLLPKLTPEHAEQTDTQKLAVLMQSSAKLPRLLPKQSVASTSSATVDTPADTGQTHSDYEGRKSRSKFYAGSRQPDAPFYTRVLTDEEVANERKAKLASPEYAAAAHRCAPCVLAFAGAAEMHKHLGLHLETAGDYACHICLQRVRTMKDLSKHRSQHTVRYCCSYCHHRATDRQTATRHSCDAKKQQLPAESPAPPAPAPARARYRYPPRTAKCAHCFATFADEQGVARHTAKHHSEPPEPAECKVCNKVFPSKYLMKRHSYIHKKMRLEKLRPELFCAECKMAFSTPSAYRAHGQTLRHATRDQWQFECDICGQKCPSKSGLKIHIQIVHSEIRDFKCDKCPKTYVSRTQLRRHIWSHDPDAQPRPHVCEQCGKAFKKKKTLSEHIDMHAGVRSHACPLCPATFTFKAALYTHNQLIHLKIKRKWDKKKKGKKVKVDEEEVAAEEK